MNIKRFKTIVASFCLGWAAPWLALAQLVTSLTSAPLMETEVLGLAIAMLTQTAQVPGIHPH